MTRPRERPWQEVVIERYRRKGNPKLGPLQVKVALPFVRYLDAAAKVENVTRATFIRRACAVQMQRVLGGSITQYLLLCPESKPYGTRGGLFDTNDFDTGQDIEQWCPHPGCDGSHI